MRPRLLAAALLAPMALAGLVVPGADAGPTPTRPGATAATPPDDRAPGERPAGPRRPNIVLFLTDDQNLAELSVMRQTRRLLAPRGTTFTRAFSQYPLCCPARATLLTGQLPHNHGVLGNEEPWGGYGHFRERSTLPVWLQRAGYRTGMVGKYLNGYPEPGRSRHVPRGWTDWRVPVEGITHYRSFLVNEDGALRRRTGYQARWTAETTSALVREYARGRKPFFIWSGFLGPHVGGPTEPDDPAALETPAVEDRYRDRVDPADMPTPRSFLERDLRDKGRWIRHRDAPPAPALREHWAQRREALLSVDDAVASVVRTLRGTGELRDTVIVFTSDNGFMLGEHGLNQKIYGYEESVRVPLLVSGPGVERDVRRDQLVGLADLPATFLDLARARPGLRQDGRSLLPLAADPDVGADRSLLLEAGGWPFRDQDRLYTGLRTPDDHVLLRWWNRDLETYDLSTDPLQLDGRTSRAEREWRPRALRELRRLRDCAGRECWAG